MTIVFVLIVFLLIIVQKRREKNWGNLITFLMAPYLFLVSFNNFFVYKLGFYKISDQVLEMLLFSFILFFIGCLPFKVCFKPYNERDTKRILLKYNVNKMYHFLLFVGILGIIKFMFLIKNGSLLNDFDDEEGMMSSGILGHLLLISYTILPIYFLNWTYKMSFKRFVPILLIIVVTFSSFIKYHIIGLFVVNYIFMAIYRRSAFMTATIIVGVASISFFIVNYAIGFFITSSDADTTFYLGHLWKYMSGSIILDNYIFTSGINNGYDTLYKLLSYIFVLPNMFLNALFGIRLFPTLGHELLPVSLLGEESNSLEAIGNLYPSRGSFIDVVLFGIIMLLIGALFSLIFKLRIQKYLHLDTFIAIFICYFVFFSFFGTFYVHSGPWELLIWSLLIPKYFYKHEKNTVQHLRA